MANPKEVTLHDFVNWCIQKIDAYQLSMLMAQYGYSSYTVDNVVALLEVDQTFVENFGALVKAIPDTSRGLDFAAEITKSDWLSIALGTAGSLATQIGTILGTGGSTAANTAAEKVAIEKAAAEKAAGSKTFLYIIVGVVVLAVVVILGFSLAKK